MQTTYPMTILSCLGQHLSTYKSEHSKMADREEDPENEDDTCDVIYLTEYARRQQWCAGYLFQKVGKIAATAVGGGFLLLQIANHSGYVQVDWKRVEKDVNKAKRHLKKNADRAVPEFNSLIDQSTEFVKTNVIITSGFFGGFLLGLAS
ncbi:FUN14 domain-containing protein 1 isoform X3 [Oncorhynchus kisutch]|uniref:FUN14 domain-containing protein 1 isoform X3 n=1 Tax=Oncorhynchus kisutch TaxID=8019 RepID=UPI0012DED17E|nr:FUN14 domain-containing protein 1 isoform X3 [Oncorhynchus kisutch]